jgi:phosphate transport system protein
MARPIFDAQLLEIKTTVIEIGTRVATALDLALQILRSGDQILCNQIIASDKMIDDLRFQAEQLTLRTLVLQQPVFARDTRFLSSILAIIADLERIGDGAAGIAQLRLLLTRLQVAGKSPTNIDRSHAHGDQKSLLNQTLTEDSIVSELFDLGQEACQVLRGTMRAFAQDDADAARKIWQEDDVVDVRYHMARHNLMTTLTSVYAIPALTQDETILQRMTYWLWIAHKLERVGDHCTNICERIVFFLEGAVMISPTRTE